MSITWFRVRRCRCEPFARTMKISAASVISGARRSLENAMRRPSGDQAAPASLRQRCLIRLKPVPSAFTTKISTSTPTTRVKASRFPSGDHAGETPLPTIVARAEPSGRTTSIAYLSISRSCVKAISPFAPGKEASAGIATSRPTSATGSSFAITCAVWPLDARVESRLGYGESIHAQLKRDRLDPQLGLEIRLIAEDAIERRSACSRLRYQPKMSAERALAMP